VPEIHDLAGATCNRVDFETAGLNDLRAGLLSRACNGVQGATASVVFLAAVATRNL
jgi:hypothetical protein